MLTELAYSIDFALKVAKENNVPITYDWAAFVVHAAFELLS